MTPGTPPEHWYLGLDDEPHYFNPAECPYIVMPGWADDGAIAKLPGAEIIWIKGVVFAGVLNAPKDAQFWERIRFKWKQVNLDDIASYCDNLPMPHPPHLKADIKASPIVPKSIALNDTSGTKHRQSSIAVELRGPDDNVIVWGETERPPSAGSISRP
jgi:hypothetical protein